MTMVDLPKMRCLPMVMGLISLLACVPVHASDNSKSTLEVFELLTDKPIGDNPPPPIIVKSKPPSLQLLKQELATQRQTIAEQQSGLIMAQRELAFWQSQNGEVPQMNVQQWTQAVASDQHLVATVEARINQLLAQIAAAQ